MARPAFREPKLPWTALYAVFGRGTPPPILVPAHEQVRIVEIIPRVNGSRTDVGESFPEQSGHRFLRSRFCRGFLSVVSEAA